jgi:Toprim domain-containing protein
MTAVEVKEGLKGLAEEFVRYLFPAGTRAGHEWLVGSLAGEPGKSLAIRIGGDKVGLWSDFATGERGSNLLELYIQFRRVDCGQAIKECAEWLGSPVGPSGNNVVVPDRTTHQSLAPKILPGEIYSPTDDECQQVMAMIARMCDDAALRERVARARRWNPATLRKLALEGYLGWHHEKLAFIYDSGVKLRWRENGERIIRWAFGKPWLWRGAYLNFAETVYVCEGETDAIALIDAGVEQQDATIVVALPSASTFNPEWAELFKSKDVILVFDADSAGQSATAYVSQLLLPFARSLKQLEWEGLEHAC